MSLFSGTGDNVNSLVDFPSFSSFELSCKCHNIITLFIFYQEKYLQDRCYQRSTRPDPTVSPMVNIVFSLEICFVMKSDILTDNICENNDHYRPWLWVWRVDQYWLLSESLVDQFWSEFHPAQPIISVHWLCSESKLATTNHSLSSQINVTVLKINRRELNWKFITVQNKTYISRDKKFL